MMMIGDGALCNNNMQKVQLTSQAIQNIHPTKTSKNPQPYQCLQNQRSTQYRLQCPCQSSASGCSISQNENNSFEGFLGYGSRSLAPIWQTVIWGIFTMGLALAIGCFIKAGTSFTLTRSLIMSSILASIATTLLLHRLHTPYRIQRNKKLILGHLRSSTAQKKLICFCIGFELAMSMPVIGALAVQNSTQPTDTIFAFLIAFFVQIVLASAAHMISNHIAHQSGEQSSSQDTITNIQPNATNIAISIHRDKMVVRAPTAYFRDLLVTMVNLGVSLLCVGIVFGAVLPVYFVSVQYQLNSKGFCQIAGNHEFRYKRVQVEGVNQSISYVIELPNDTEIGKLPDGSAITPQYIQSLTNLNPSEGPYKNPQTMINRYIDPLPSSQINPNNLVSLNNLSIQAQTSQNPVNGRLRNDKVIRIVQSVRNISLLYRFTALVYVLKWMQPAFLAVQNRWQYRWFKKTGYRGAQIINFTFIPPTVNTNRKLYLTQSSAYGVLLNINKVVDISNSTDRYIQFCGGVFDRTKAMYMYNVTLQQIHRFNFTSANHRGDFYNFSNGNFYTKYGNYIQTRQIYIDQQNSSTAILQTSKPYQGEILAVKENNINGVDTYIQWSQLSNPNSLQTISSFNSMFMFYEFTINHAYAIIVIGVAIVNGVVYRIWRRKINNIFSINYNGKSDAQSYHYLASIYNFFLFLSIFLIGGSPILSLSSWTHCYPSTIPPTIQFSYLLCLVLFQISQTGPNRHSIRSYWINYLISYPATGSSFFIRTTLQEMGIDHDAQLLNFISKQGLTHWFMNSFKVRALFRNYAENRSITDLEKQVWELVQHQLVDLNREGTHSLENSTYSLCMPVLLASGIWFCKYWLDTVNGLPSLTQISSLTLFLYLMLLASMGILSVCLHLFRHRGYAFVSNWNGVVDKRQQNAVDKLKIILFGLMIQVFIIGMMVAGLYFAKFVNLEAATDRFLVSWLFGGIGSLIGCLVHWGWNSRPGLLV